VSLWRLCPQAEKPAGDRGCEDQYTRPQEDRAGIVAQGRGQRARDQHAERINGKEAA
jgi:hypothetical protein